MHYQWRRQLYSGPKRHEEKRGVGVWVKLESKMARESVRGRHPPLWETPYNVDTVQ